jgi:hypothetical protein
MDKVECASGNKSLSPMLCYFQRLELNCPGDVQAAIEHPGFDPEWHLSRSNGNVQSASEAVTPGMDTHHVRTADLEFLFTQVSPLLMREATRQFNLVFGDKVPNDLITVHICWGDKGKEMKLVKIADYIKAIHQILDQCSGSGSQGKANIFLATEDPAAIQQF